MGTYTQNFHHIIFRTKRRERVLTKHNRHVLYKYITGILRNKRCFVYIINGVECHLHIVTSIHPTVSLSSLVKDIKVSSSLFIKEKNLFQGFKGWQIGYASFTFSQELRSRIIHYVSNQEVNHEKRTFKEELRQLLIDNDVLFEEKYL